MSEKFYIIDGHSQIFRAYYAPFRDLTSPSGEPTRATYVFTNMLLKFIADKKPDYLAMAIDGPHQKLHRAKIYSEYKVTRKPTPEDFRPQEQRIMEIVRTLGIPILEAEGYEADDILATLADRYASEKIEVILVSRDKDLDQLITSHVMLYDPMKDETLNATAIEQSKGYTPAQAVEIQTLMGDSTDNIPGVPGVGPKTALKLIQQYGTADAVLAAADEQTPKLCDNLKQLGKEGLELSRKLVTLDKHVPMDLSLNQCRFTQPDMDKASEIFAELGFTKLVEKYATKKPIPKPSAKSDPFAGGLFGSLEQPAEIASPAKTENEKKSVPADHDGMTTAADFDYQLIDTPEALNELAESLAGVKRLAVDTETTAVKAMNCSLVGISMSWKPGHGVYIPVIGPLGATTLDIELIRSVIGPVLADTAVEKIGHNLKYDLIVLENNGFTIAGKMFDTMIAAHVIDSQRPSLKMDYLAIEYLRHRCIPITDLIGSGRNQTTMNTVPTDTVAVYAAEDADVTLRMADVMEKLLDEMSLRNLFENLEMPLMPILTEMERAGITVDPAKLKSMQSEFSAKADSLRDRILQLAGTVFNPDSPKQLADILFAKMGYPVIKKTRTGASTDSEVLEQLAGEYDCEIAALLLEYRKLMKLISTYLIALVECINPKTGRVHTSFHQASVITGRLSSSDPNLQNIPAHDEGKQIRSAFIAQKGCKLISADYSQVELRMLAHFCGDETLCKAFADDLDIHRIVASEVFGVEMNEVTPDMRSRAKTVNFGIVYGQTGFGLARTLGISRTEASEFIRKYKQRFPKIEVFLAECVEQAREKGYVETISGRRRQIPEIDSRNQQKRNMAERTAINTVVQGSAADLIKQAMINLDAVLHKENSPAKMLLQIHDELIFETPEKIAGQIADVIVHEMANAIKLSVSLKVDCNIGDNWLEAKQVNP